MKVGLFILSSTWGGAEEVVFNLSQNLKDLGIEVSLFVNDFLARHYSQINHLSICKLGRLAGRNKLERISNLHRIQSRFLRAIERSGVDLVHAHLEKSLLVLGARWKRFSPPVIFTLHGEEAKVYHQRKTLEQKLVFLFLNKLLKDEKTIVTSVSRWQIKDFKDIYRSKVVVIPNGVDCHKFRPLKVRQEKNSVLYVGRLIKDKGIGDLIKIAKQLKECEFLFVGTGPLGDSINLPNTRNLGFKKRDEVVRLYAKATICAFPSYAEGFPIVGLEAMACGKAVVASKIGFGEYIKNSRDGILVEPGNLKQLTAGIIKLIQNPPLREKLGHQARKKALEYHWPRIVRRYLKLYHQIHHENSSSL